MWKEFDRASRSREYCRSGCEKNGKVKVIAIVAKVRLELCEFFFCGTEAMRT